NKPAAEGCSVRSGAAGGSGGGEFGPSTIEPGCAAGSKIVGIRYLTQDPHSRRKKRGSDGAPADRSVPISYDEQNGGGQPGASAHAVVHRDQCDCARSGHDSDGGGAVLRIAEWIQREPAWRGCGFDGDASGILRSSGNVGSADFSEGGGSVAARTPRGHGCTRGLGIQPEAAGGRLRDRLGQLRPTAPRISLSFGRPVSSTKRCHRR